MFKNNLTIAYRNLAKRKEYTVINILGLAIGIASCLLIGLFVQHETSYDEFIRDAGRIHKMVLERKYPEFTNTMSTIPHSFSEVAASDFPEIETSTSLAGPFSNMLFSYKNNDDEEIKFIENYLVAADSNFFNMFNFNMIKGEPRTALKEANAIVLTASTAKRYFGDEDPMGKIMIRGTDNFQVTGIIDDLPEKTHFKFDMVMAIHTIPRFSQQNFVNPSVNCYLKLRENADAQALSDKLPSLINTYAAAQIEREENISWENYKKNGNGYRLFLQPLTSVYLDPLNLGGMKAGGNIKSINVLIVVAIFIFIIACVNFVNLSTARSAERAKEVGLRKTMGSLKKQLIFQFLTESFIVSVIGVIISVLIIALALPAFNELLGKHLEVGFSISALLLLLGIVLFVGLLAGIYPSFVLSSFKTVDVLKGNFATESRGHWIRNGLVIFQFWISIALIICMLVMKEQIDFLQDKPLGFQKDQLMVVEGDFHRDTDFTRSFMENIRQLPTISSAAGTLSVPEFGGMSEGKFKAPGSAEILTAKTMYIGDHFAEVLGLQLLQGRFFADQVNDSLAIILNETAIKTMGIDDPIGKKLTLSVGADEVAFTIVGVVKDFNFETLKSEITPLAIQSNEVIFGRNRFMVARVKANHNIQAIKHVEAMWKQAKPGTPFQYRFLDQVLDRAYQKDQQFGQIFVIFSGLSIFIACIGLFALSAYNVNLRTKEIGIRKVLGAEVKDVLMLLSKETVRIILLAFFLAVPMAWYAMEKWWLLDFAYRVDFNITTVIIAGIFAFVLAWVTVGYQAVKAAIKNPAVSLRS